MKRAAPSIVLALVLAACGASPRESFYTLSESSGDERASLASQDYGVVVGPVSIPDLVDRPQFVLRMSGGEVRIAEQVRWAEPLRDSIARAVASNLAHQLDNARVAPQTTRDPGESDYQVLLDVQRFDSVLSKAATLEVVWTLRRGRTGSPQIGRTRLSEVVTGSSYHDLVAAHTRALGEVSKRIAEAIRISRQNDLAAAPAGGPR
ncbi:MAG TPA: PqiC family protein [Burkholderiales bacterium]|nr:PqiC family protein [Burkholderiales bacterium]